MEFNDCLYIIPSVDKQIKLVFEGTSIKDNEDMTFTIRWNATLLEIAEWFDMTVDEVLNTKFIFFEVTDEW